MEMSESFATTAAAVAPVLWAIGTFEVQQLLKRLRGWHEDKNRLYDEAVVAMSQATDEASLVQARALWGKAQRWWLGPLAPWLLYVAWAYLSITMVGCTAVALRWLAEDGGPGHESGAASSNASFIYWALAMAMLFITTLPMWIVTAENVRWGRRVKMADRAVRYLDQQAQARIEERADRPETGEPQRP
ncbi:hypothetical protein [Streptomyces bacillaris]|uniref:hypothetical protein n=1 Tax=Streptomyces bacillaris TaxID=68179 RepID=UPI00382457F7